jgi:hypothetical protein
MRQPTPRSSIACFAFVVLLGAPASAGAGQHLPDGQAAAAPAIFPIGPACAALLARAETRSLTVRDLAASLRTSGTLVLVRIESRLAVEGLAVPDRSTGVARIVIGLRRHADADEMIPWLAHELQHAVEIAAAGASSPADARRLYERIGFPVHDGHYETRAALEAGERARADLLRPSPPREARAETLCRFPAFREAGILVS